MKINKGPEKAQDDEIYENITKIDKKGTIDDFNLIVACLKNHFVFYNLSETEL